jgi:hypothetical protein
LHCLIRPLSIKMVCHYEMRCQEIGVSDCSYKLFVRPYIFCFDTIRTSKSMLTDMYRQLGAVTMPTGAKGAL